MGWEAVETFLRLTGMPREGVVLGRMELILFTVDPPGFGDQSSHLDSGVLGAPRPRDDPSRTSL